MHINRIEVSNYRSLFNFEMDLRPFSLLIGRNDAGKSNVLRAVQLLLDSSAVTNLNKHDWSKLAKAKKYPRKITFQAELGKEKLNIVRRVITLTKTGANVSQLELFEGGLWRSLSKDEELKIPSFYYLRPRTGALQEAFNPKEENNIYTLIRDWMPVELSHKGDLDKLLRKYSPGKTTLKAYVDFFQNEVIGPLGVAFPSDFPVLQLNPDFRTPEDRGLLFVRELSHSNAKQALFRLPLDHHGTGLISVVAMVLSIAVLQEYHSQVFSGKPLIIAIEEPEVHLHPNAQRTFLQYLKLASQRNQFLVTTHSPIMIDRSNPLNVTVLRRATQRDEKKEIAKAGATICVKGDYKNNWSNAISELGVRLSDVLMGGEINVVVEGATEKILLPAIAEVLQKKGLISFNFDRVFLVNGDGGNIPNIVTQLKGFGNPILVILDNDKGGNDIKKALSKSDNPPDDIFPLPNPKTLPNPLCNLKDYELEDLLSPKELLISFNEIYQDIVGYEFLPVKYDDYQKEQLILLANGKPFGFVSSIGSLIGKHTSSPELREKKTTERFNKRLLAESVAEKILEGTFPIPKFFETLLVNIGGYLGD